MKFFKNKDEIKKTLKKGEMAVVVRQGGGYFIYGTPSREEEDIRKLKAGAQYLYSEEGIEVVRKMEL